MYPPRSCEERTGCEPVSPYGAPLRRY